MRNKQIQEKISELKARLLELNTILHEDIGASYREATQTSDMIEMLEMQIFDLQKLLENNSKNIIRVIEVENKEAVFEFFLVKENGNPAEVSFSISSPFGEMLNSIKVNDKIKFRNTDYLVKKIDE